MPAAIGKAGAAQCSKVTGSETRETGKVQVAR